MIISFLRLCGGGMGAGFSYRKFYLLHLSLQTKHISAFASVYSTYVFFLNSGNIFKSFFNE